MLICCSLYCVKLFSPPYCLTPPGKLWSWLMWYFQSLELLAGQREQALNTSCHRPGYVQMPLPHLSLAAKSSQSSETAPCLSPRAQMQLNSLFPFVWPQKHTCLHSLLQATCLDLFRLKVGVCLCFFFLCPGASPLKNCRRRSSTASEMLESMFRPRGDTEDLSLSSVRKGGGKWEEGESPLPLEKCPRQMKIHFRGELAGGLCMHGFFNSFSPCWKVYTASFQKKLSSPFRIILLGLQKISICTLKQFPFFGNSSLWA